MALNALLSLIASEGAEPRLNALERWTETVPTASWEAEPDYGLFVDDSGHIVAGTAPVRAFLESDDPTHLTLAPETQRRLDDDVTVVFLDWGHQSLSWEEIFELWDAWDSQDMVADCGAVGVSWEWANRWIAPSWIAFRGDFDGSPLTVVARPRAEAPSFLARARQLRAAVETPLALGEPLPMLPFTLKQLRDPATVWPQGVA